MKQYEELSKDLQEIAREWRPDDYEAWAYKVQGVEIAFCAKSSR